jgi:hypothetical protein
MKVTGDVKPGIDTREIINEAGWPAGTVALVELGVIANGAAFVPMIWVRAGDVLAAKLLSPL